MSTLYRKYRPQKFSDLIGQEHLTQTLINEIATDRIAHAYLFSGPRGIGKTTMARLLAKAINCENRKKEESEPCNKCSSCSEIAASRNIDVIEIDAASHTGVDNVRENIIDNAQFKPTRSRYKVFIIDEAHMLSTSAFNALLKTLEEPPAHAIFVLATTEYHKLPATIISRCQRFNFKKIKEETMLKKLESIAKDEGVKIDKEILKRIVEKSEGCMRDAESLLGQLISLNVKKIGAEEASSILPAAEIDSILNYLKAIAENNVKEAIEIIDLVVKEGASLDEFALQTIEVLRAIMVAQSGHTAFGLDFSENDRKRIRELSSLFRRDRLIALIDGAIKRRSEMKYAPVPQLPLELLAVEFSNKDDKNINNTPPPSGSNDKPKNTSESIETKDVNPIINSDETPVINPNVTNNDAPALNMTEANNFWSEVVLQISEKFPSLAFVLKMAEITETNGNCVNIAVPYSFHKEKIEENKCRKAIENIFSDLAGNPVLISCSLKDTAHSPAIDAELNNLAAEFGGELVN